MAVRAVVKLHATVLVNVRSNVRGGGVTKCPCPPSNCVCPPGAPGAPGPAGPQGEPGSIGTIAGSFDTVADLIANEHNHQPGNFYVVGGELYFWDAEHGQWASAGYIQGPPGPQGPQGEPGGNGPMPQISVDSNGHLIVNGSDTGVSLIGPQGPQGLPGAKGDSGPMPDINVGTNGHLVVNGSDTGVSLIGPKGPQGEQGDAGSIGTIAGSFDTVEDLIANEHNHQPGNFYLVGTHLWFWSEEQGQWEDAGPIEGPPGPKGDTGPMPEVTVNEEGHLIVDGEDTGQSLMGPQGPQGPEGPPGRDGTNGTNGTNGHTPQIWISSHGTLIIDGVDTGVSLIGPQGPAGDSGAGGVQKGIQAELAEVQLMTIPPNGIIPFNIQTLNASDSSLSYNPATYTFTINQPGVYAVDWWLGVVGAFPAAPYVEVGLDVNGTIGHIVSQTGTVFSNMAGHDLLNVTTVPTTVRLVNTSNATLTLGRGTTQGGLLITG